MVLSTNMSAVPRSRVKGKLLCPSCIKSDDRASHGGDLGVPNTRLTSVFQLLVCPFQTAGQSVLGTFSSASQRMEIIG